MKTISKVKKTIISFTLATVLLTQLLISSMTVFAIDTTKSSQFKYEYGLDFEHADTVDWGGNLKSADFDPIEKALKVEVSNATEEQNVVWDKLAPKFKNGAIEIEFKSEDPSSIAIAFGITEAIGGKYLMAGVRDNKEYIMANGNASSFFKKNLAAQFQSNKYHKMRAEFIDGVVTLYKDGVLIGTCNNINGSPISQTEGFMGLRIFKNSATKRLYLRSFKVFSGKTVETPVENEVWRKAVSGLKNNNEENSAFLKLMNDETKNLESYKMSFDIMPVSDPAQTRANFCLKYQDPENWCAIGFNGGKWTWSQKVNGVKTNGSVDLTLFQKDKPSRVGLVFKNNILNITVDGKSATVNYLGAEYTTQKDTRIAMRLGTYLTNTTAIMFKNVKVTNDDESTVYVENNRDKWSFETSVNGEAFIDKVSTTTCTVSGKVTDKDGNPIENVKVSLNGNAYFTNAEGSYTIKDLKSNNYSLIFEKQGYIASGTKIAVIAQENVIVKVETVKMSIGVKPVINFEEGKYLENEDMKVAIDNEFPRVIGYQMKKFDNKLMYGQTDKIDTITVNGNVNIKPVVSYELASNKASAIYTMVLKDSLNKIDAVVKAEIKIVKNTLEFNVLDINNNIPHSIKTLLIRNHNLVSIKSNQVGAAIDGSNMSTDTSTSGDSHFVPSELSNGNKGFICAFVSADGLSAGTWSNSQSNSGINSDVTETWKSVTAATTSNKDGVQSIGLHSSTWTYQRGEGYKTEELPSVKVAITGDVNEDNVADWQDGAIAYRSIMHNPKGSEKVPDLASYRISQNMSSQAQNPFLLTLDYAKKVFLATDGLGQSILLKGYGSEGHDSGHLNYADIGRRMGGAEDMKLLLEGADKIGADIGIHVNASETYPESKYFEEKRLKKLAEGGYSYGWTWLEQAINIDADYDLRNGREQRFIDLYNALGAEKNGLDYIYVDVWGNNQSGDNGSWASHQLAREIQNRGWAVAGEWGYAFAYDSIFQHWACDLDYGDQKSKGINSTILRFIRNHQKDSWVGDHEKFGGEAVNPLLGGMDMVDFEGWQGGSNFNKFIETLFDKNIPTKFLQHFLPTNVVKGKPVNIDNSMWTPDMEYTLKDKDDNKVVVTRKSNDINSPDYRLRKMTLNDKVIMDGNAYTVPWNWDEFGKVLSKDKQKLYHLNQTDNRETTWDLPQSWNDCSNVKVYKLTEYGKAEAQTVSVIGSKVTLTAQKNVPYVIHKGDSANAKFAWSEHSHIVDVAFNSGNLDKWTINGPKENANIVKNSTFNNMLMLNNQNKEILLTQKLTDLKPNQQYAAYVGVDNVSDTKAYIEINVSGKKVSNFTERSIAKNYIKANSHNTDNNTVANDSISGSKFQNMYVFFTAPKSGDVTLTLRREAGEGATYFDDIRILENNSNMFINPRRFEQNFENTPQGIFPFVVGGYEGVSGNRIHLSENHEPYTKQGWNDIAIDNVISGNWSLKVCSLTDGNSLIYQTVPQNFRIEPNKSYKVSFDYAQGGDNTYAVVTGNGQYASSNYESFAPLKGNAYNPHSKYEFIITGDQNGQSWFGISSNQGTVNIPSDFPGKKANMAGFKDLVMDNLVIECINDDSATRFISIFNVDGKETVVTTNVGEAIVMPLNSKKDGYTFKGWYTAEIDGTKVTEFTQAQIVYAHWIKNFIPVTPSTPTNGGGSYNPPVVVPPVVTQTTGKTDVVVAAPSISETMTTNEKTVAKAEIKVDTTITDKATATNPVQIKTELPTADVKSAIENSLAKQVEIKLTVPNAVATNKNVSIIEIKADKSIFEQAKTSGKEIVLKVETADGKLIASWSFDGTKITNTAVDVNLAVNLVKATTLPAINTAGASAATKPLVVSFEHSGNLPATAKVTLDVSSDYNNGESLFLYYFNAKTKKLELISKGNKVVDGKVTIAISHCSDYVLTKTAIKTIAPIATAAPKTPTRMPKTGDTTPIYASLVLVLLASVVAITCKKYCK